MKVYCEDCEFFQPICKDITMHTFFHSERCYHSKNRHIDKEKNKKYPDALFGCWEYGDYIADVTILDREPREINKDYKCKWFKVEPPKWWKLRERKRKKERYK